MMRNPVCALVLGLLAGCSGPEGPVGPTGPVGPLSKTVPAPALIGVFPTTMLSGQTTRLRIFGTFTHFAAGSTTLTFDDPAITVGALVVGGANYLEAPVTVAPEAKFGAHDLTVTTKGVGTSKADEILPLTGIYAVGPSLRVVSGANDATTVQGGLLGFSVNNLDVVTRPFNGTPGLGMGRVMSVSSASTDTLTGQVLVDALLPAGPLTLSAVYTGGAQARLYAADPGQAGTTQVLARTPKDLTLGQTVFGERFPDGLNTTSLYKFSTAADNQVLVLTVVNAGGSLGLGVYAATAPASGKFASGSLSAVSFNALNQTALAVLPKTGDQYLALMNATFIGGASTTYHVTARTAAGKSFSAAEPATPDNMTSPLAKVNLGQPGYAVDGAIDFAGDVDWLYLTAAQNGRVYVNVTQPGQGANPIGLNPFAPQVTLYASDCVSSLAPARAGAQECPAIANTTYCAKIEYTRPLNGPLPYQVIVGQDVP